MCIRDSLYLWGNGNMADIKIRSKYQGKIAKVALTDNEYIALLTDGTVAYTGNKDKTSPFAKIPAGLKGKTVVDIASTSKSVAAVTEDGEVYVWGNEMCIRDSIGGAGLLIFVFAMKYSAQIEEALLGLVRRIVMPDTASPCRCHLLYAFARDRACLLYTSHSQSILKVRRCVTAAVKERTLRAGEHDRHWRIFSHDSRKRPLPTIAAKTVDEKRSESS